MVGDSTGVMTDGNKVGTVLPGSSNGGGRLVGVMVRDSAGVTVEGDRVVMIVKGQHHHHRQ